MRTEFKKGYCAGPGGIKCACCRPPKASKREAQTIFNRKYRRTSYKVIAKALAEMSAGIAEVGIA